MLAYYLYPFAPEQELKEYTKQDLMNPQKVEELFDYCQILEGYITKVGGLAKEQIVALKNI